MQPSRSVYVRANLETSASAVHPVRMERFSASGRLRSRVRANWRGVRFHLWSMAGAVRQVLEALAACIMLIAAAPFLLAAIAICGKSSLRSSPRMGRECRTFNQYKFESGDRFRFLRGVPTLWNIIAGDMSFVGPRPMAPQDIDLTEHDNRRRHAVRPGLVCLWWVRERANIAYGSEPATDVEYVETSSFRQDLALMLRALPAMMYGVSRQTNSAVIDILGIPVQNITMADAIDWICDRAENGPAAQVSFINPHCANIACTDAEYRRVLHGSDLNLGDGIGIKIAGRMLGTELKQNVNGTDLFPRLMETLSGRATSVYLLGARPGVVDRVREWIETNHPGTTVAGAHHGYFSAEEGDRIVADIAASGAAILIVAFGVPQQEKWIAQHLHRTGVRVAIGVGGLFDFYSGRIPRAPMWMREMGLEWTYRFAQEPRRMWKRYFVGNGVFLWRVLRQKYQSGRV